MDPSFLQKLLQTVKGVGGQALGGGSMFVDPLIDVSTGLTTQLRRGGLLPTKGIATAYGGSGDRKISIADSGLSSTGIRGSYKNKAGEPYNALSIPTGSPAYIEYRNKQLAQQKERLKGVGNPPETLSSFQGGLAERNYEAEKRRAAQLAMQDQLSKKYQVADLTKAYNTASPEEKEKIGLQIWATTNPQLAQKLRPGQTGYSEAVSAVQSQGPMGAITKAVGDMEYADRAFGAAPTTPVPAFGTLQAPISGINLPPADQLGVKENLFASAPPGVPSTVFTDPLKSFSPEALSQTQLALLRQAFNKKLK